MRELSGIEEMTAASTLWDSIWAREDAGHEVDPALMVALSHAGGYLAAAYDGGTMIGAALGFWGSPTDPTLHSHITAVLPGYAGQGVGSMIKFHQRDWVLERGGRAITWPTTRSWRGTRTSTSTGSARAPSAICSTSTER